MTTDITLTASARSSLLSLQNTQDLLSRTQDRLTSGKKVNSAIDDAISYFRAKGLDDRASDFSARKSEIDQGISSLKAGVSGTTVADSILKQMKGIIDSVRTADKSTRATLSAQFKDLSQQLNSALGDASYQGLNLVNTSKASLTVYFSQGTAASLKVSGNNIKTSKILTKAGAAASKILTGLLSAGGATAAAVAAGFSALSGAVSPTKILDNISSYVDNAISKVRAVAAQLGGNVTFLNTRLDFTSEYINTLKEGSDKLTLADLNEEGANLVTLQTRQQIGIQTLSLAGQQQQAILSLLR